MIPKKVRLRSHHIGILIQGKEDNYRKWEEYMKYNFVDGNYFLPDYIRYTKDGLERMVNFFRDLSNLPSTEIEVVNDRDYVCGLCDNLVNGKCKSGEETPKYADEQDSLKYGLLDGHIITVKELLEKNNF